MIFINLGVPVLWSSLSIGGAKIDHMLGVCTHKVTKNTSITLKTAIRITLPSGRTGTLRYTKQQRYTDIKDKHIVGALQYGWCHYWHNSYATLRHEEGNTIRLSCDLHKVTIQWEDNMYRHHCRVSA